MVSGGTAGRISRRTLLVGGGAGVGLLVAWRMWPRTYLPHQRTAPGENLFSAYLKIGNDGRVVVAVPQAELGQGVYTSLPQILADELGADWRTVAVEPAPIGPLYANGLLTDLDSWLRPPESELTAAMVTGGSTSVRAFAAPLRQAGAGARALLAKAAARRWGADWRELDTNAGFVVRGKERIPFADLAEAAAREKLPDDVPLRGGIENRLVGQPLPRLDLPAKVDGSAPFAGDVRLPDMVYASVRQGPIGGSNKLLRFDRAAADAVPGVFAIVETPGWVAAAATNWWAANRAVEAMKPVFETTGGLAGTERINGALDAAMRGDYAKRILAVGDIPAAFEAAPVFRTRYSAGIVPTAALETLTATARLTGDRLEVWAPAQAPGLARAAAARAAGLAEHQVTLHRPLVGGGYGRKLEVAAIEQAVTIALKLKRPVQLVWSRIEETMHDSYRPPALAALSASMGAGGRITGWHARMVAPSADADVAARIGADWSDGGAAVAGAAPPYAIPSVAIDHVPVAIGLPTGLWRSGPHSVTAFFNESFVDELAHKAKVEPLSFRMQMLGDNPRLARCLSTAAALGGWDGGEPGSALGLACHSAFGSHAALLVEVSLDAERRLKVTRAVCAVDCGEVINPDIVRQQIEGGIVYGIGGATGRAIGFAGGLADARGFDALGLPRLADSPEITVEIIPSEEPSGGVTELGVPVVAPAIANALFALTGERLRSLPLVPGSSQ